MSQFKMCKVCQRVLPLDCNYCPNCDAPLIHLDSYDVFEMDNGSQDEQQLDERRLNALLQNGK